MTRINELKKSLMKRFKMIDMGAVTKYLGIEIERRLDGIVLYQKAYLKAVLDRFGMGKCTTISSPMDSGLPGIMMPSLEEAKSEDIK